MGRSHDDLKKLRKDRDELFDELCVLRDRTINHPKANVVANAARATMKTWRDQFKERRMMRILGRME